MLASEDYFSENFNCLCRQPIRELWVCDMLLKMLRKWAQFVFTYALLVCKPFCTSSVFAMTVVGGEGARRCVTDAGNVVDCHRTQSMAKQRVVCDSYISAIISIDKIDLTRLQPILFSTHQPLGSEEMGLTMYSIVEVCRLVCLKFSCTIEY